MMLQTLPIYISMASVALALGVFVWWVMRISWRKPTMLTAGGGRDRGWMLNIARTIGGSVYAQFPRWLAALKNRDKDELEKAGLYPTWDSEELLGLQLCGGGYGLVFSGFLINTMDWGVGWILVGVLLGGWLPRLHVSSIRKERQLQLLREFPTAIDMIMLGLEGGLDVTSGIKEMIENSDEGPLRTEFIRLYKEISMGESRSSAFRKLIARIDAMEVRAAIMSMVQAMEMGSEIGPLMRVQAEQLRFNRLTRAEEAANKAPTKMMLPMVLFILPCMFIVIFAPIMISLVQSLGSFGD